MIPSDNTPLRDHGNPPEDFGGPHPVPETSPSAWAVASVCLLFALVAVSLVAGAWMALREHFAK